MINDNPTTMELEDYVNNTWRVMPKRGHKVEDMLKPEYWAHISGRMRAGDRIVAVPNDRSYFVEFFVLAASKNWAKVVLMRECTIIEDSEDSPAEKEDEFAIGFAGAHKWRVTQGDEILSKDHDDKESAEAWLKEHKKEIK